MQLKEINDFRHNGQMDTFVYIVDENAGDSLQDPNEHNIYNMGSVRNGAIEKLTEFSNSVNNFFLQEAIEDRRDSILSCRSYGIVYLITKMLEKWGISTETNSEVSNSSAEERLYRFLPSLLTALLDYNAGSPSAFADCQLRIHSPKGIKFEASTIRSLIDMLNENPPELNIPVNDVYRIFANKLLEWAASDCGSWCKITEDEGVRLITFLAGHVYDSVEKQTGMQWDVIYKYLSELQAIRIERGAKTFLLTTRPTSKQMNILNRLDIKPPPLVVCEHVEQPVIMNRKVESNINQSFDLMQEAVL